MEREIAGGKEGGEGCGGRRRRREGFEEADRFAEAAVGGRDGGKPPVRMAAGAVAMELSNEERTDVGAVRDGVNDVGPESGEGHRRRAKPRRDPPGPLPHRRAPPEAGG